MSEEAFNRELKKLSVALEFDGDLLRLLARAGGAEISRNKAQYLLRGDRTYACPRELLGAVLDGVIEWKRGFKGDIAKFVAFYTYRDGQDPP